MEEEYDEYPEEVLDPADVEDEQSDLMFAYKNDVSGDPARDPVRVIEDWLPDKENWSAKTNISLNQARPMAAISEFPEMFPNIIGDGIYQAIIDGEVVQDYKKLLTSWEGESRKEQVKVLSSMPGKKDTEVNFGADDDEE